jgi:hypothetical protein
MKAYFWWIESVLATGTDYTSSNIISRDCRLREGLNLGRSLYLPHHSIHVHGDIAQELLFVRQGCRVLAACR